MPGDGVERAMSIGGSVGVEGGAGLERVGWLRRVLASSGSFDCGRRDEAAPAYAQDDGDLGEGADAGEGGGRTSGLSFERAMLIGGSVGLEGGAGLERGGWLRRGLAFSGSFDCGRRDEAAPAFAQDDGDLGRERTRERVEGVLPGCRLSARC